MADPDALDPSASDAAVQDPAGPAPPSPWAAIHLNNPGWGDDSIANKPVQFWGLDGLSSDLEHNLYTAMRAHSLGQDPGAVDPGARPFMNLARLMSPPKVDLGPGVLWPLDGIRAAPKPAGDGASQQQSDQQADADDDGDRDGPNVQEAAVRASRAPFSSNNGPAYPHTLDPIVDRHVAEYNQMHGFKPGDAEYLDPDLIKAMVRQEAGNVQTRFKNDPMTVNGPDWDDHKTALGLSKGVPPGQNLGIKAGIGWLRYKSYAHDKVGKETNFLGWQEGVTRFNGGGDPHYWDKINNHMSNIKAGR